MVTTSTSAVGVKELFAHAYTKNIPLLGVVALFCVVFLYLVCDFVVLQQKQKGQPLPHTLGIFGWGQGSLWVLSLLLLLFGVCWPPSDVPPQNTEQRPYTNLRRCKISENPKQRPYTNLRRCISGQRYAPTVFHRLLLWLSLLRGRGPNRHGGEANNTHHLQRSTKGGQRGSPKGFASRAQILVLVFVVIFSWMMVGVVFSSAGAAASTQSDTCDADSVEGVDVRTYSTRTRGQHTFIFRQSNRRRRRPTQNDSADGYNGVRVGDAHQCGPLKIRAQIAGLKCDALVDTGSDFDAIDLDLSAQLRASPEHVYAFVSRRDIPRSTVGGFTTDMQQYSSAESEWDLTFHGSDVFAGELRPRSVRWTFNEFKSLGDPLIFGLPFIRAFSGFEMADGQVWIGDMWIPELISQSMHAQMAAITLANQQTGIAIGRCARTVNLHRHDDVLLEVVFDGLELENLSKTISCAAGGVWWMESCNLGETNEINVVESPVEPTRVENATSSLAW